MIDVIRNLLWKISPGIDNSHHSSTLSTRYICHQFQAMVHRPRKLFTLTKYRVWEIYLNSRYFKMMPWQVSNECKKCSESMPWDISQVWRTMLLLLVNHENVNDNSLNRKTIKGCVLDRTNRGIFDKSDTNNGCCTRACAAIVYLGFRFIHNFGDLQSSNVWLMSNSLALGDVEVILKV